MRTTAVQASGPTAAIMVQEEPGYRRLSQLYPLHLWPTCQAKAQERKTGQARSCAHVRLQGRGSGPFSFCHRKQALCPIRDTFSEANLVPWKEIRVLLRRGIDANSSITKNMPLALCLDSPFQPSPYGWTTICTALWCFDSTSLPRGCLSFLVACAASWEQRMPHPMRLGYPGPGPMSYAHAYLQMW